MNGFIDSADATFILGAYSAVSTGSNFTYSAGQKKRCDVDGNGKVDSTDATLVLRFYADANGTDEILTFTLNDKLNFKRVEFSDLNNMREAKDGDEARDIFHSAMFLVANEYRSLLERILESMGGEVIPEPAAKPEVREPVAAIDDEL